MPPPVCNLTPFDLETGVRVASKVLRSKFGHARPLGSRIIRYVCDRRTDRQTDGQTKAMLTAPFPMAGGMTMQLTANGSEQSVPRHYTSGKTD